MTAEERALVERLRAVGGSFDPAWHNAGTVNQAASLIERIAAERDTAEARVKELEEALRAMVDSADVRFDLPTLRRARAALGDDLEASISDTLKRFPKTLARLGSLGDKT